MTETTLEAAVLGHRMMVGTSVLFFNRGVKHSRMRLDAILSTAPDINRAIMLRTEQLHNVEKLAAWVRVLSENKLTLAAAKAITRMVAFGFITPK